MPATERRSRVTAVLGPTNTGKTHHAIDRMLGHASGMIGFPLRLLARENYDRIVVAKGRSRAALVTGEEKIVPPRAEYLACTVEAMPVDREVDFLAVDEIQLCADPERGHVFTDRLLRARGRAETMFLGAETVRPLIRALVPEARFETRRRLSRLSYAGPAKMTRLPRRSTVVAFSIDEIYAVAELMRRRHGGAAIVLGALSPRTRNAQVAMYQSGEVDYMVATDAIGMGLNMNIDHVAFASRRKFDGRRRRALSAAEMAQIAGRSGRHLADGTFGPVSEIGPFDADLVSAIEEHRFPPVAAARWRNADLDFSSLPALRASLDAPPPGPRLIRARDADDQAALGHLARDPEIAGRATTPDAVRLLWEACRIPDFRRTMAESHVALVRRVYGHLSGRGHLPTDVAASRIARLDRTDGDIDTLMARIAHVRTWTYIAHRPGWLRDAEHWQARTRALEDRLSDALHRDLTRRFVDRRAGVLARARSRGGGAAVVDADGGVSVAGASLGRIEGLRFVADGVREGPRGPRAAAARALRREIGARAAALAASPDAAFAAAPDGTLTWAGATVARLAKGADVLSPAVTVLADDALAAGPRERVRRRLSAWTAAKVEEALRPLPGLRSAAPKGLARGIAYRVASGLGSIPRRAVAGEVRALSRGDRAALRACGVRIGAESVYVPSLVKPGAVAWRALLWAAHAGVPCPAPPPPGRVAAPADGGAPKAFLEACGYRVLGGRAVRVDVLERLAVDLRTREEAGRLEIGAPHLNLLGLSMADAAPVLEALGYAPGRRAARTRAARGAGPAPGGRGRRPARQVDEASPFAKLKRPGPPP